MRVYFDTEFTGLHQYASPISIGFVADDKSKFYAEFNDYDKAQIDEWLITNVIDNLTLSKNVIHDDSSNNCEVSHVLGSFPGDLVIDNSSVWNITGSTSYIAEQLETWLSQFDNVEMWSDCLAYNWVLFCQLFGHAFNIPKNVYYIPFDLCTAFKLKGVDPDINREEFAYGDSLVENKHNALWDAQVIRDCVKKLNI